MKIYFEEDSLEAEQECAIKGCRLDVLVYENECFYRPIIYTLERLTVECNSQIEKKKYFLIKLNYIIISAISKENIIAALLELQKAGNVSLLQSVNLKKEYSDCFQELQDVENWTQVYPEIKN